MPPPPSSRDGFEIAIVCALPHELDAVDLLIDEYEDDGGGKYGQAVGDPNVYSYGRIAGFDVVLVLLPSLGKVNAASAVTWLQSSFTNLKLVLLTGVCGAVPLAEAGKEILLGDVIIGRIVVQYDFGRRHPGKFTPKLEESLSQPTGNIRNLIHVIETARVREILEHQAATLLEHLQSCAAEKGRPETYRYPGAVHDRLFRASYLHGHQTGHACTVCQKGSGVVCHESSRLSCTELGCHDDDKNLVPRARLEQRRTLELQGRVGEAQSPSISVGPVGSADTVLRSGEERDRLSRNHGLLAFEMESAGIWNQVPCIVVKGACDYADSHKNKCWQNFAAATAASVVRALLERCVQKDRSSGSIFFSVSPNGPPRSGNVKAEPDQEDRTGDRSPRGLTSRGVKRAASLPIPASRPSKLLLRQVSSQPAVQTQPSKVVPTTREQIIQILKQADKKGFPPNPATNAQLPVNIVRAL